MAATPIDLEWQVATVERVLAGDATAEHELVEHFRRRVFVMMLARVGQRDAAEELTQDTLLAVVAGVRKGQLRTASSLGAFVHGVARNLANNHIRQRSAEPAFTEVHDDLHVAAPAIDFDDEERMRLVRREISRLEPIDRTILMRTLVEGAKPGVIAEDLGVSSEVVRTRKSRAVRKLVERVSALSRSTAQLHSVDR